MSHQVIRRLAAVLPWTGCLMLLASAFGQTTADGHPDLQGTWTNATLTPFQRPAELGAKQFFTEQEAAAFEKQRTEQTNVDRPRRGGRVTRGHTISSGSTGA